MKPSPSVVGIILARLDSKRLPGKALREVRGLPLVGYVINRAKRIASLRALILATSDRAIDDPLAEYARAQGVAVSRGDADDVARRVLHCAVKFGAAYFVRINGDSPFLDPALVNEGMTHLREDVDLVTNLIDRTFPYGIAVEIVRVETLKRVYKSMSLEDREHVTRYVYDHLDQFKVASMRSNVPQLAGARLVMDTEEDLDVFERLIEKLGNQVASVSYETVAELQLNLGF